MPAPLSRSYRSTSVLPSLSPMKPSVWLLADNELYHLSSHQVTLISKTNVDFKRILSKLHRSHLLGKGDIFCVCITMNVSVELPTQSQRCWTADKPIKGWGNVGITHYCPSPSCPGLKHQYDNMAILLRGR